MRHLLFTTNKELQTKQSEYENADIVCIPEDMKQWDEILKSMIDAYDLFDLLREHSTVLVLMPSEEIYTDELEIFSIINT